MKADLYVDYKLTNMGQIWPHFPLVEKNIQFGSNVFEISKLKVVPFFL